MIYFQLKKNFCRVQAKTRHRHHFQLLYLNLSKKLWLSLTKLSVVRVMLELIAFIKMRSRAKQVRLEL